MTKRPDPRRGRRRILVVLLATFILGTSIPNLFGLGKPFGDLGFTVDSNWVVHDVNPRSNAGKAGLRAGDRIDTSRTTLHERLLLKHVINPLPGVERITVPILARSTGVSFVGESFTDVLPTALTTIAKRLVSLILIIVCGLTLMRLPSPMTWGLFFYALIAAYGIPYQVGVWLEDYPVAYACLLLITDVFYAAGFVGALVFGLRVPLNDVRGWRAAIDKAIPWIFWPLLLLLVGDRVFGTYLGMSATPLTAATITVEIALLLTAMSLLIVGYVSDRWSQRSRVNWWVVIGFTLPFLGMSANVALNSPFAPHHGDPTIWFADMLRALGLLVAVAVTQALLNVTIPARYQKRVKYLMYASLVVLLTYIFEITTQIVVKFPPQWLHLSGTLETVVTASTGLLLKQVFEGMTNFVKGKLRPAGA